jgi:Domain of unknown function (DUF4328)
MSHRARSAEATPGPGPGWLGRSLIVLLGVNVVVAWMAIQASFVLAHAVWLAAAGQILAGAEPGRIAGQIARLRLAQAVLWVGTAGLLLAWIHRAHRTLETLGLRDVRAARDAVRECLIPGANVVRIPRVIGELWRASAGERDPAIRTWVMWWWALCLATVALDLAAILPARRVLAGFGPGGGLPLLVLGECLRIAAAILTIVVVGRIERHQRDWHGAGASATPAVGA